jgi:HK97 family phage major capsid protein
MNLKAQLAALQAELLSIKTAAQSAKRDFTDDELTQIEAKSAEATDLKARIERIEASEKSLAGLIDGGKADDSAEKGGDDDTQTPLGERFMKSDPYQRFLKSGTPGVGSPILIDTVRIGSMKEFFANRKAGLTSDVARVQPVRVPTVDLVDRPQLSLLDLISRGQTGGNFEYVQIVSVTRNAAIVAESTSGTDNVLKPVSELTTALADAKVYTYADGYEVTNQLLADAPAFATYMDNELRYSLDGVVEDKLLHGSGVNGEPKGLFNTSGVQELEFTGAEPVDFVKAVRKGITKVTRLQGGRVDAVLINPEDEEAIDLMQDGVERFYGQGPFGTGPATLWGRARVLSEAVEPGSFILGDFKQIALLDREGLSIQAFNQHKDFAQRNRTYVRAELRAAQVVWKPARLVIGTRGTVNGGTA